VSINALSSSCGEFVDKIFSIHEITAISSITICKIPPKNEKAESDPVCSKSDRVGCE